MSDSDRKRKRAVIPLSSSSSSSGEDDESEFEVISDDEEEEESELDGDLDDDCGREGSEESICNRITSLLEGANDLEALRLNECKVYLRKHGLRLAGTKAVCIQRIKEHWRIKDGNGEAFYPRSSFVINCTGDVCKGDVVLFTQKVYEKFSKVTRQGKLLGTRTVAGRVVKESYGSAKQQHTFTVRLRHEVEVLWSKGIRKLHTLFPLLVKGRNLYKLKTFRQRWKNEAERQRALDEKHKRGAMARHVRAMKKSKILSANGGVKPQSHFHHTRSSQLRKTAELGKRKRVNGHKKNTLQQQSKFNNYLREAPTSRQPTFKRNARSEGFETSRQDSELRCHSVGSGLQPYPYTDQNPYISPMPSHTRSNQYGFFGYDTGSALTMMRLPQFRPYADTGVMAPLQSQGLNYSNEAYYYNSTPSGNLEMRSLNLHPNLINAGRPFHQFHQGMGTDGRWVNSYQQHRY